MFRIKYGWLLVVVPAACVFSTSCRSASINARTPRAAVARMILAQYLPADSTREVMTVYASHLPVGVGVRIRPNSNRSGPHLPPPIYQVTKPAWLFVIDRNTMAKWAHDVTYILVPTDGSPHVVYDERAWPLIEEKALWFRNGHMEARATFIVFEGLIAAAWRDGGRTIP